jgi:hypothetical protein
VPGLYLWGFLTPPVEGADFLAALVANCLRGALPPVDYTQQSTVCHQTTSKSTSEKIPQRELILNHHYKFISRTFLAVCLVLAMVLVFRLGLPKSKIELFLCVSNSTLKVCERVCVCECVCACVCVCRVFGAFAALAVCRLLALS